METLLIIGLAYYAFKKFMPELTLPTTTTPKTGATSAQELLAPLGSENPENLLQLGAPLVSPSGEALLVSLPVSNPTNPVEIENSYQGSPGAGSPSPSGTAQGQGVAAAGESATSPALAPASGVSVGFNAGKGVDGAVTGAGLGFSMGGLPGAVVGAIAGFLGAGLYGGSSMGSGVGYGGGDAAGGGYDSPGSDGGLSI